MNYPADFQSWPLEKRNGYFAEGAAEYRRNKASEARRPTLPPRHVPAYERELTVLSGDQLLTMTFPPRVLMLAPWLPEKGLAMIFAPRGVGKTWIALSIAHAVAGGGEFLCWRAPRPRRVLYIDGEMPAAALQERYRAVFSASGIERPPRIFAFWRPISRRTDCPTSPTPRLSGFSATPSATPS